jgi:hypothetical protein
LAVLQKDERITELDVPPEHVNLVRRKIWPLMNLRVAFATVHSTHAAMVVFREVLLRYFLEMV